MKKWLFYSVFSAFCFIIVVCTILGTVNVIKYKKTSGKVTAKTTVVIDAGHGSPDGGAVASDGTCEKDINLNIAYCLRSFCEASGYNTVMTRTGDSLICDDPSASLSEQNTSDLHNRLEIAESTQNSVFISIHLNKYSESQYWGAQVFYSPNNPDSKLLSEEIQNSIITQLQPDNTRLCKEMDDSVYIIYNATMPAVLVECGFLSNADELEKLKTADYQEKLAFCIFSAISDYCEESYSLGANYGS